MFGLSDVYTLVRTKNECEDWKFVTYTPSALKPLTNFSFFRYCHLNCSESPNRPEDTMLRPPKPAPRSVSPRPKHGSEGEVEIISDYSWRNFFSSINFLKILEKMTKHRSHRTYMLNQYKSSVSRQTILRSPAEVREANIEADVADQPPDATAPGAEAHQEPNALVWAEVAPK
jgi:hypothetical protein